ncbi:MAG: hypothetical protein EHM34_09745 [Nitrosopumilales archaeon]|nr:MAG: hypothetical protein EHM34_09745 [Nitrosopumilales archaeon]
MTTLTIFLCFDDLFLTCVILIIGIWSQIDYYYPELQYNRNDIVGLKKSNEKGYDYGYYFVRYLDNIENSNYVVITEFPGGDKCFEQIVPESMIKKY